MNFFNYSQSVIDMYRYTFSDLLDEIRTNIQRDPEEKSSDYELKIELLIESLAIKDWFNVYFV